MTDNTRKSKQNHPHKISRSEKIVFGILVAFIIAVLCGLIYQNVIDVDRTGNASAVTDTDPAVYKTEKELVSALGESGEYPELYHGVLQNETETVFSDYGTIVIPGLNGMKTLNLSTGEVDLCKDMVPQGLTVAGDYLLFTTYCHEKEHSSMVVLLDKTTGEFIKEIPLIGKPHVGGITYDKKHDIVWVSGRKNHEASAIGLNMQSILEYDSEKMDGPISYTFEELLPEVKESSFMTCKGDALYVGCFEITENGEIEKYRINEDGSLLQKINADSTLVDDISELIPVVPDLFAVILSKIQGISFAEDNLLMAQSYGPKNSKLLISDEPEMVSGLNDMVGKHIIAKYVCPSYMENICYSPEDGKIYFLFEGAAKNYREKASVPVDRILCVDAEDYLPE